MHVYLREEPVDLVMREVDSEGLLSRETDLVPVAFFAAGNERPSFRAILPPETVHVLRETLEEPVHLGLMAEEPEAGAEIHAMVGITLPVHALPEGMVPEAEEEEEDLEPWQSSSAAASEAWRGEDDEGDEAPRTVLLAFAPLVRIARRHPHDFGEELADLLESALSGATKPNLEARVDHLLGGI
jgi:hypothetical protein